MALPSDQDTKLWLALLHEIDLTGGVVEVPSNLYPKLRQYFPQITDDDLALTRKNGGSKWINRIQWVRQYLVYHGCLHSTPRIWRLTDIGREWYKAQWHGATADYSKTPKPPAVFGPLAKRQAKVPSPFSSSSKRMKHSQINEATPELHPLAELDSETDSLADANISDQTSAASSIVVPETEVLVVEGREARKAIREHTEIQYLLLKLGGDLGLQVWVAPNDRNAEVGNKRLTDIPALLSRLPVQFNDAAQRTIELIDVLWLQDNT